MRRRIKAHYDLMNGGKLVAACVLAGVLIALALGVRAWQTGESDAKICEKVDRLTVAWITFVEKTPKPPAGTRQAQLRADFLAAMRGAACDPKNLPPAIGG